MTAIFTVLGLGLFSGGLYAVYSGWPYLVLERGFTQVIIGSIMATAGLLMLSLAFVLREIRAMRRQIAEAGYSGSYAETAPAMAEPAAPDVAEAPWRTAPLSEAAAGVSQGRSLGPSVVGVGAAGLAAGAVAAALSQSDRDEPAEGDGSAATQEGGDRDLFGRMVAEQAQQEPPDEAEEAEEQPAALKAETGPATPDLFAPATDEPEAAPEDTPIATVTPSLSAWNEPRPAEPTATWQATDSPAVEPPVADRAVRDEARLWLPVDTPASQLAASEVEAAPIAVRPITPRPIAPSLSDEPASDERDDIAPTQDGQIALPAAEVTPVPDQPEPAGEAEIDEFAALRRSLTDQLGPGPRIEPSVSSDPFALPDDWLSPRSGRIEPSFASPVEDATSVAATEPPDTAEAPGASEQVPEQAEVEAPGEALAPVSDPGEPEPPEAESAPEQPPSSEEGVVGAYQVGDAHFTIYADGSIRARTPDGEYSFGSMDELKVYLASEKSRLGV